MKIHGLNECLKRLQFDDKEIGKALQSGGDTILQQAKSNVHVLTGDLKNSLDMNVTRDENGWTVNIGSDLFYAAWEEFGTGPQTKLPPEVSSEYGMEFYVSGKGHQSSHPYLFPAYRQHRDKVVAMINDALKKQY